MSIVVVTIPGASKQSVVQNIQHRTNRAVALVVVQTPRPPSYRKTFERWRCDPERWYSLFCALRLRLDASLRRYLELFRARTPTPEITTWSAPVLETDNINASEVIAQIKAVQPTVLAVWGSTIISEEMTTVAPHAINLHMGCAPHYRGAIANQRAVERRDLARLGFTIHHINETVDAGNIIKQTCGRITHDPKTTFTALNDAAEATFVDVIAKLYAGDPVESTSQVGLAAGENVRLREWTPAMRYRVALLMKSWHDSGIPPATDTTEGPDVS